MNGARVTTYAAVDAAGFDRVLADQRHPLWWGILGLIAIELTVVAMFVVGYFYLRMGSGTWPPPGIDPPPLLWESINMGCLAASAAAMWWAGKRITAGDQRGLSIWLAVALALDAAVLVFRGIQMHQFDFRWDEHAYGSIVWTVTGFHFTHVASAIVGTGVVLVLALRGWWNAERQLAVVVDTLYWYFVSFAWLPLYLAVYWGPRVLP